MDINLKPPKKCGDCKSRMQLGYKHVCVYYGDDTYGNLIDIGTRPDWCPLAKMVEKANQMSDENKRLFNQMCDGMKAMFELMNNNREENS